MDYVCPHGLIEARRFLVAAERDFRENGTLEFDSALLLCFLAGRKSFVVWAIDRPVTIDRYTIQSAFAEAFLGLKTGKIKADWEDEWRPISQIIPLCRGQRSFRMF